MATASLELTDRYDSQNPPDIDSYYGTLHVVEWSYDDFGGFIFSVVETGLPEYPPIIARVVLRPEQIEQLKNFLN